MSTTEQQRPVPSVHPWLVTAICAGAMFMEMLDGTVILTAFPRMAADFDVRPVDLSIGVTAYLLALAALLPASGWIADRFGTRRVFLYSMAGFALTSVLCALSPSLMAFAAARALQGACAALMSPVARMAMVRTLRGSRLAAALNFCAMTALLGPTIGPPLGGWLATYWDWRWIFLINVPVGVAGWLLARAFLPDFRRDGQPPLDRVGFLLNALALMSLLYGLEALGKATGDRRVALAVFLAGVLIGALAVRHARRRPRGLVDIAPLAVAGFRNGLTGGFFARFAIFAPTFILPLLLQLGLGLDAFTSGLYIMIGGATDVLTKLFVLPALRRLGFRRLLCSSALLYAAFPLLLVLVDAHTPGLVIALLLAFGGSVRSFHMSASNMILYADLPPEQVSGGSTLASLLQQLAVAVSVALSALLVDLAARGTGASAGRAVELQDFRLALVVAGLASLWALRWYLRLRRDAGAELSGRSAR